MRFRGCGKNYAIKPSNILTIREWSGAGSMVNKLTMSDRIELETLDHLRLGMLRYPPPPRCAGMPKSPSAQRHARCRCQDVSVRVR